MHILHAFISGGKNTGRVKFPKVTIFVFAAGYLKVSANHLKESIIFVSWSLWYIFIGTFVHLLIAPIKQSSLFTYYI